VDEYIVELSYTIVQVVSYAVSGVFGQAAAIEEAKRILRDEKSTELDPHDRLTVVGCYVEKHDPRARRRLVIPVERLALLD
jgi:hypothetical protein